MLSPEQHSWPDRAVESVYQKFSARLRASLASTRPMEGSETAVAELVAETKRLDRKVEHAVALLNRAWDEVPEHLRPTSEIPGRSLFFDRLVTMTIETYYGQSRAD